MNATNFHPRPAGMGPREVRRILFGVLLTMFLAALDQTIVAPALPTIARDLHGLLSAQDSGGWRPHVTIQNKARPSEARALLQELKRDFQPRPLGIAGLALHRYLGGPWETVARYPFRGR